MKEINGKRYLLWEQFVNDPKFVGGVLEDSGDSVDRRLGFPTVTTKIKSINLKPNGKDSAWFEVEGVGFTCGADVSVLGLVGGEKGWITVSGYGGHTWRFKPNE